MKRIQSGFSMIELLVAVAVLGILLALGTSTFRTWIANMRIRATAESIQNGLQMARAEAVRRNAQIRFQFVDNVGGGCALSTTESNWIVSFADPAGACDAALLNEAFPADDAANNPDPRIIQLRVAAEGSNNVVIAADQSTIVFNGLGRVTPVPATNPVVIDVSPAAAIGACGDYRCLRVTVSNAGQVRMCDPSYPVNGADPQRCN